MKHLRAGLDVRPSVNPGVCLESATSQSAVLPVRGEGEALCRLLSFQMVLPMAATVKS